MKKILLTVGFIVGALVSAHAQNIAFYTTYEDWTNWNGGGSSLGNSCVGVTSFDYDGVTKNGIGNPSNAGGAGTGGSLQINAVASGWGLTIGGPGLTTAQVIAMDGPGAVPPYSAQSGYGPGSMVAQSGNFVMTYALPSTGSYFQPGIFFQDNNMYSFWFSSSITDKGPVTTPNGTMEMYEAIIPYSISACASVTYTEIGVCQNSGAGVATPWYVDSISVVPLFTAPPGTSLFTTSDDFALFTSSGGDLVMATNDWSVDTSTTNGVGNTIAPGASGGSSGSLLLYWSSLETSWGAIAVGPSEDSNTNFLQAIDPGCDAVNKVGVSAYGNIYMTYSMPDNSGGGTYFEVGVNFSYAANGYNGYAPFWPSSTTDLNTKDDNGYEVYQAVIPYSINAGYLYGFTPSIYVNSDYQPTNGFHIDAITVSAAEAPLITGVSLNGSSLVINGKNGLAGNPFHLLTSTNISTPMSAWTVVGSANTFTGTTFSITNTVNPSVPASFYRIRVP